MPRITSSPRAYGVLVALLSLSAAASTLLPQGDFVALPEPPAPAPVLALVNAAVMLFLYGGLGLVGLWLGRKVGFPDLLDPRVSDRERWIRPALAGIGVGVFFILADLVFSPIHGLGLLPHPPFPTSLVASVGAGIGEEIVFRLFFVSFWLWLVSNVLLKGRWHGPVFWVVTGLSALAFSFGHVPALMMMHGWTEVSSVHPVLMLEILVLNGVLSFLAAHYLRRFGFLAAAGVHFWTDIVWHVMWGPLAG